MTNLYDRRKMERREMIVLLDDMYRAQVRFTAVKTLDLYKPVRKSTEKIYLDVVLDSPGNAGTVYDVYAYAPPNCPEEDDSPIDQLRIGPDLLIARSQTYHNKNTKIYRGSVTIRSRVIGGNQHWLLLLYK